MMERLGVATAAEVDIDTLAARLQHALDEHQASHALAARRRHLEPGKEHF